EKAFHKRCKYAVAFHGWSKDYVGVGGLAPTSLRKRVVNEISSALVSRGSDIEVKLEQDSGLSGSDPNNIVNRITISGKKGIQIEQALLARKYHWATIADAVANVFKDLTQE